MSPVAKVVSGYSGDPDTRGDRAIKPLNLDDCEVGDLLYRVDVHTLAQRASDWLTSNVPDSNNWFDSRNVGYLVDYIVNGHHGCAHLWVTHSHAKGMVCSKCGEEKS